MAELHIVLHEPRHEAVDEPRRAVRPIDHGAAPRDAHVGVRSFQRPESIHDAFSYSHVDVIHIKVARVI